MAPILIENQAKPQGLDLGERHYSRPLYQLNRDENVTYGPLPLPPPKDMPVPVQGDVAIRKGLVKEPVFDPDVHLNLEMPPYVRLLSTWEKAECTPDISKSRTEDGTDFAYTAPFNVSPF